MTRRLAFAPAALLVLAGGLVHLQLWEGGYRGIDTVGDLFLVQVGSSVLAALALLVLPGRIVAAGVALLAVGSLVALVLSRTVGVFGFTDVGITPESVTAAVAEAAAIGALAVGFLAARAIGRRPPAMAAAPG